MSVNSESCKQLCDKLQEKVEGLADSAFPISAPAKLNLRLKLLGRRKDGYHLLSMLNCTTSLADELCIKFTKANEVTLKLEPEGVLNGSATDNLGSRAFRYYWEIFGFSSLPLGMNCFITKKIPVGAGLGGGSADAGGVLRVLSAHFAPLICEHLSINKVMYGKLINQVALKCGADVPYAYTGGLCWVQGVGEDVREIALRGLDFKKVLIIIPRIQVNTTEFYQYLREELSFVDVARDLDLEDAVSSSVFRGASLIQNDFERHIVRFVPEVGDILSTVRGILPSFSSISGSGSAIFALIPPDSEALAEKAIEMLASRCVLAKIFEIFY